jgi:hypothetical protein
MPIERPPLVGLFEYKALTIVGRVVFNVGD